MPTPADPKPITDSLQRHLDDVLARIPSGKRVRAETAITTQGFVAGIGARVGRHAEVAGWAGREWGGAGWLAGARAGVTW